MFADSLLETSWDQRSRRGWITFTSFGLQSGFVGLLLLIPLLTTVGLPSSRILQPPASFAPPPPPTPATRQHRTTLVQSNLANNLLITPPSIPPRVADINEAVAPPQLNYNNGTGVPGGTGDGAGDGVWKSFGIGRAVVPLPPPAPTIREFRTSTILEGSLIRRVQP